MSSLLQMHFCGIQAGNFALSGAHCIFMSPLAGWCSWSHGMWEGCWARDMAATKLISTRLMGGWPLCQGWPEELVILPVVLPAGAFAPIQGAQERLHLLLLKFLAGIWWDSTGKSAEMPISSTELDHQLQVWPPHLGKHGESQHWLCWQFSVFLCWSLEDLADVPAVRASVCCPEVGRQAWPKDCSLTD